jgi:hypothetical protein
VISTRERSLSYHEVTRKLFCEPQRWRDRAEDACRVAARILDPITRRTMLEIAAAYEGLAQRVARHGELSLRQQRGAAFAPSACRSERSGTCKDRRVS